MSPPCPERNRRPWNQVCAWLSGIALAVAASSSARAALPAERIEVIPAEVVLHGTGSRQQVAVSGFEADGSVRDVTPRSRFSVEPPGLAEVSPSGVVTPRAAGSGSIRVEALGRTAVVSLHVERPVEPRRFSYRLDVAAVLSKAGCNMGACHGNLNGKGGFKLSLRGDDPAFDLASMTREALGRRANLARPAGQHDLLKPTGLVPHEGGQRFTSSSPEAAALLGWIVVRGPRRPRDRPPPGAARRLPQGARRPRAGLSQQLIVTAEFSDGTRRDVTRQASYDVSDPTRVSVTADGRVDARVPTETAVAVRYLGGRGVSRLAFLADRPNFVWRDSRASKRG